MLSDVPESERAQRRERRREGRRERLLGAALAVLRRDGRRQLTVAAVAEQADVSKPAVYYYFSSKAELLSGLRAHLVERERVLVRHALGEASGLHDGLRRYLATYVQMYVDDVDVFCTLVCPAERVTSGAVVPLRNSLKAAQRVGELASDVDVEVLVDMAVALAHGLVIRLTSESSERRRVLMDAGVAALHAAMSSHRSPVRQ